VTCPSEGPCRSAGTCVAGTCIYANEAHGTACVTTTGGTGACYQGACEPCGLVGQTCCGTSSQSCSTGTCMGTLTPNDGGVVDCWPTAGGMCTVLKCY
jgi:hypothetical protein